MKRKLTDQLDMQKKLDALLKEKYRDKGMFDAARVLSRDADQRLIAGWDWGRFHHEHEPPTDIVEDPGPVDERLARYKGVHNRMGQELLNDPYREVSGKVGQEDLFKTTEAGRFQAAEFKPYRKPVHYTHDPVRDPTEPTSHLAGTDMYPYRVVIEAIDEEDPDRREQRKNWKKDESHFAHLDVFEAIIAERKRRKELTKAFGWASRAADEAFGDELIQQMRIANGELMDPAEEEAYLKKLRKKNRPRRNAVVDGAPALAAAEMEAA